MSLVEGGLFHDMKSMPQAMSASSCCSSLIRSPTQKNTSLMNTKRSATQAGMLKSGICRRYKMPIDALAATMSLPYSYNTVSIAEGFIVRGKRF